MNTENIPHALSRTIFGRVVGKELDVAAMVPDGGVDGAVEQFPTLTDKREKKELANLL